MLDELNVLEGYLKVALPPNEFEHEIADEELYKLLDQMSQEGAEHRPSASSDFPELQRLGQYECLGRLGFGGMGTVYRAWHMGLSKEVALKTLPPWRMYNKRSIARFNREMKAVGRLNHPRIVKALDAGEIDQVHYLAMELIDGIDLSTLIKQSGSLAISDACEMIRQAAEGLQYIHSQGLVHRDLKPSNLMLSREGEVKILDLGLAQLRGLDDDELTRTGQIMGTLEYMAPEQSLDSRKVDIRADLYSLGITLYKLLSGFTPFRKEPDENLMKKLRSMLESQPVSVGERLPDLPAELVAVVDQLIARNPDDRMQTPQELIASLEPFCKGHSLSHLVDLTQIPFRDDGTPDRRKRHIPKVPSSVKLAGVATAATALFLGGLYLGQQDSEITLSSSVNPSVAMSPGYEMEYELVEVTEDEFENRVTLRRESSAAPKPPASKKANCTTVVACHSPEPFVTQNPNDRRIILSPAGKPGFTRSHLSF